MRYRRIGRWLVAAPLIGLALIPGGGRRALAASTGPKMLAGVVPDVVAQGAAQFVGHHTSDGLLDIAVALSLRNRTALDAFLRDINDHSSPNYHHFLSQEGANASFNPTVSDEQRVVAWLSSGGLRVTQTYPNHLLVDAQGTAGQIERLLHVSINDYHATIRGKPAAFYAPDTNATVDATVADVVDAVTGLENVPRFFILSSGPNGTAHGSPGYYPQDFANAYDAGPLWSGGYRGAGQNIAITLWNTPPSDAQLNSFGTTTGASVATVGNGKLHVMNVCDGTNCGTTTVDGGEAGMDIESSGGMAPDATINYYEAPTDSSGNPTNLGLQNALNAAGTDGNNNLQITNSWGGCEASSTSDAFTSATNNIFASNSTTGHNYFFSAGDSGSSCGGADPMPDYPASSPYVTSVGGTRFSANVGSADPGEVAWTYCGSFFACLALGYTSSPIGTGGGYSNIFSRPSWQFGSGLAANGKRGYPDIAADADPATGAYVCYGNGTTCGTIGGTSLSSPLWAGMLADINGYLTAHGLQTAGFLAPTLYSLANANPQFPEFHDVTSGTNGKYNAGPGWDAVTGWGSPDLWNLARDIAAGSAPLGTPTDTPTTGPTSTPTDTPTIAPTNTPAPATSTPTLAPTPTNTSIPTNTSTPTNTPIVTAPTAPQNLRAATAPKHSRGVSLTWNAPAGNGGATITGYSIYRGTTSGAEGSSPYKTISNVLSYSDTGTTSGQTYYYKVAAVNSVGTGAPSSEASATAR